MAEHMLTWRDDGHDLTVLTVFGAVTNGKEERLAEEHREVLFLFGEGISSWEMGFRDDAHEDREDDPREVVEALRLRIQQMEPDVVVLPVGIHHPDHVVVAQCFPMWRDPTLEPKVWRYEELPYYVLYPDQCLFTEDTAKAGWQLQGFVPHFTFKKALCRMYHSQWAPHLGRTVFAPERIWVP